MTRDLLENEHLRGAVKHPDKECWVPLYYAAEVGNELLTKFLLEENEYTAYMQDSEGRTPLHIATYCDHIIIFEMIISLYNEKDADGNTPLHHIAKPPITSSSLVYHPRVDKLAFNKKDHTPLEVAFATLEDSDFPILDQTLVKTLKKYGSKRSQRLHVLKSKLLTNFEFAFTKEAKESHLIVAPLIATVTFAATFTLPGGTIQDGDLKVSLIMGHKASFKAFIVSDTIALVMSASAVLIHLFSPLNKAKWLDYYLSEAAFSIILVAVATMVVAFVTGMCVVFRSSSSIGIAIITLGFLFSLIFRQVLRMSFHRSALLTFVGNLLNILLFSFVRSSPSLGLFRLFKRSKQTQKEDNTPSRPNRIQTLSSTR